MEIKFLRDFDFKDKNVFMRVDFNVPLEKGQIIDSHRIEKSWPSIQFILERGGRLLLASHLARPGGQKVPHLSLKPVAQLLSEKKNLEVLFVEEPESSAPRRLFPSLKSHQVLLLENLRFHPGEESSDPLFAKQLASYTDIYINEAFSLSHRENTSVTLLPARLSHKGMGIMFEREIQHLDPIRRGQAKKPFLVISGGSKLKDKIPLLETLVDSADEFLIGGLMAYTFLKALKQPVGSTFVEKNCFCQVIDFMDRVKGRGKSFFLPIDHVVEYKGQVKTLNDFKARPEAVGRDIGPETLKLFQKRIQRAGSIFWNGPLGLFEKKEFRKGTQSLLQSVANHSSAYRLVGGGHSALFARDFESELDHISTGGGASLSYLQGKSLPGIKSLLPESIRGQ